jgi:hypothetical protein
MHCNIAYNMNHATKNHPRSYPGPPLRSYLPLLPDAAAAVLEQCTAGELTDHFDSAAGPNAIRYLERRHVSTLRKCGSAHQFFLDNGSKRDDEGGSGDSVLEEEISGGSESRASKFVSAVFARFESP